MLFCAKKKRTLFILFVIFFVSTGAALANPAPATFEAISYKTKKYGARFVVGAVAADTWSEARRRIHSGMSLRLNKTYFIKHKGAKNIWVYIWYIDSDNIQLVQCNTNSGRGWLMANHDTSRWRKTYLLDKVGDGKTYTFDPTGSNCIFKVTNADNRHWGRDTILVRWDY